MTEQCSKEPLMVTIRCITYNHEPYIRQCLEGFVMQKTNFRFEAIVHDDASTDGTADIIREFADKYPGIIKPIFETENQYSKHDGSIRRIMDAHTHGKYVAICEGDDYWIDPLKLQKQVDYMDSHPSCSMCFTGAMVKFDESFENVDLKVYHSLYNNLQDRDYDGEELLLNWLTPSASILHRTSVDIKRNPSFMFGDIIIVLSCAAQGKVHCLSEKMVVYRRNANGASAKSQPLPRVINHYSAIAENFGKKYSKACNHLIYSSIASSLLTGNKSERQDALSALKEHPSCILNVVGTIVSICFNVLVNKFK